MREYLKGGLWAAGAALQRIAGSPDIYDTRIRGKHASVNFLTCHDGFTLYDLNSYNQKHNEANGWGNLDGSDDYRSWNCGAAGDTDQVMVVELRLRMMKNAFAVLLCSRGTPMFLAGDEFGNTKHGNNNTYCQDNETSWINWKLLEKNHDLFEFFKFMIRFRNAMGYYDIHTHQMPFHKEDIAIINRIVSPMGDMQPGSLPETVIRSYGIHPWYIYNVKEQMDLLRVLVSGSGVVAIGEAGLDTLAESPMDLQKEVFLAQANLAEETHKPLIIHCVKAWADLIACKKAVKPEMPWIIHGFRGNGELASQLVRLGFYLSFGDRFNPSALRAAWPDFLFLETDDKSIDIRGVYQNVAEALDIPEEKLRIQIAKNVSIFHLNG